MSWPTPLAVALQRFLNDAGQCVVFLEATYGSAVQLRSISAVQSQVAYILNLRGNDVAHSPVAIAYLLVTEDGAKVFIDQDKVSTEVEAEMKVKSMVAVQRALWGEMRMCGMLICDFIPMF